MGYGVGYRWDMGGIYKFPTKAPDDISWKWSPVAGDEIMLFVNGELTQNLHLLEGCHFLELPMSEATMLGLIFPIESRPLRC